MHDERDGPAVFGEERVHALAVADVQRAMAKARQRRVQLPGVPFRGSLGAEEVGAHVVVDAHHVEALRMEKPRGFAADQARGPGNDDDAHSIFLPCCFIR
jgi:hypothetical protein